MSLNHPSQGEGFINAYQISATPFVTSSVVNLGQVTQIEFGYISRFIVVRNTSTGSTLAVSFTANGLLPANSNYFTLGATESFSADLRTDRLFVSGAVGASCSYTVVGGLTFVPSKNMTTITGSNGYPGVG